MNGEKRGAQRKHLHYPAWIAVEGVDEPLPCFLVDISETGARVSLQAESDLPETVVLVLSPHGVKRRCRVAWREGTDLGMEFIKPGSRMARGRRPER